MTVIVVISGRVSWSVRGGDWLCQLWLDEVAAGFEPSFGSSPDVAGDSSGSTGLSLHMNNSPFQIKQQGI